MTLKKTSSIQYQDIQTLEQAYDAVLQIDRRLRNRRQSPRNESPSRWSSRDHHAEDSRHHDREVSYPHTPSRYDQNRDRSTRTPGFEEEREGRTRTTAWTLRHRSPSKSPSYRSDSSYADDGEKYYSILKNSDKDRKPSLYCWHCGITGHDGKSCRKHPRSPKYQQDSRDSSVESNKSLNFDRAQRIADTMSGNKEARQRTVRFEEETSSKKHLPHASKPRFQNWSQERENS